MSSRTDQDEIQGLREEVYRLSEEIKTQTAAAAENVKQKASYTAGPASDVGRRAHRALRNEGAAVAEAMREHPVATSSALTLAAGLGLFLGYAIAVVSQDDPPRRRYW